MKGFLNTLVIVLVCCCAVSAQTTYVGSTPAHQSIREFLQITLTDSLDFIRWKLDIDSDRFNIECRYGLSNPGTAGFSNEQQQSFSGQISRSNSYFYLQHQGKTIALVQVNTNILHFIDQEGKMLSGNGGYSYALNNTVPVVADEFNIPSEPSSNKNPLVFEGRTPCQQLSALLGLNKTAACNKMKWYFLFYTDSLTSQPSYFLKGGLGYRKETMARGSWKIVTENGRIFYKLYSDSWVGSLDLLKGDDNILFFVDANGRLLVGNEDFSYTLNRREKEYPPIIR